LKNLGILKSLPILYVEDDDILRASTQNTLSVFFDDITTATDGVQAIKLLNEKKFYVAILDIRIPHISGIEVAQEIRKNDRDMLIFITSSHQETSELRELLKLNMVDYLVKPFSFSDLMNTLQACAQRLIESGGLKRVIYGSGYYDFIKKCIVKDGQDIKLTKNEISVLELFFEKKGAVVSFDEIERCVFEDDEEYKYGAIKNLISRLRKKIAGKAIVNVYEVGYYLKQS
jgi:two-component system, OmpR family, response regulator VanR